MDVLEYFRLDEEPFKLSPSPRFLYLNDQVKQAIIIVVEPGGGDAHGPGRLAADAG